MALSPYKGPQSPSNRNRSSSCSSPIRNRILYQEVYSIGPNTLVRSYSCDQVFDKDVSGRTFQTTQIHVSSFITPEKKICVDHLESEQKKPRRLAVEFPTEKPDIKNKNAEFVKKPSVLKVAIKNTLFTWLAVTTACAFYYYLLFRECSYVWDLERTEIELRENVFGQDKAIAKINSVLKKCNSTNDVHIMIFTGGVGVGKTYSSSIISQNFPWSSNKLITYSEDFITDVEKLVNQELSVCGCNLVIVDNLSIKNTREVINLIILLNNKRQKNENLLYILIFKTHTDSERSEIIVEFDNAYFNPHHVSFKLLSKDAINKCFISEIKRQQAEIPKLKLQSLVENKMKPIDIVQGPSGCKGVADDVASYCKSNLK